MYKCNECVYPFWKSDKVFCESFMPVNEHNENELLIPLLYHIDEIISVKSASLEREYIPHTDFILRDGMLILPKNSSIEFIPWSYYNPNEPTPNQFLCSKGGYLAFTDTDAFHNLQYVVTYKHSEKWQGFSPEYLPNKLKTTRELLDKNDIPFTVGFLGDSISYGLNSSGLESINVPPYLPIWPKLIADRLEEVYSRKINFINRSVGGTASAWGAENIIELFKDDVPNLFVIAFGMNDASGEVPKETYIQNIKIIMDKMLTLNPHCEFVIVSTTLPNPLAPQFYKHHETYEPFLKELVASYGDKAELARMTSVHKFMLTKKRYYDMTGNNINHPNDFLARVYAQVILTHIIGE